MSAVAVSAVALVAWLLLVLAVMSVLRAARLADENEREAEIANLKAEIAKGEVDVERLLTDWPGGAAR